MTSFSTSLALGSALNFFSVQPLRVVAYHRIKSLFIAHHNLIKKWFAAVMQNKTRQHFKTTFFFWLLVTSRGTHLLSFFTFPICFKCQMTIEWLMLHSSATSHVVCKRISFNNGSQLGTVNLWQLATTLLIFKVLSLHCKTSWTTTALYIC